MKKIYALLLLVSLSALSGCFHHHHDRHERGDNRGPQPQEHRGHYDDRSGPRR